MLCLFAFDFLNLPTRSAVFNPQKTTISHLNPILQNFKALNINTLIIEAAQHNYDESLHQATINFCINNDIQIIYRPGPFVSEFLPLGGIDPTYFEGQNIIRSVDNELYAQNAINWITKISSLLNKNSNAIHAIQLDNQLIKSNLSADFYNFLRQIFIKNGIFGPFILQEDEIPSELTGFSQIVSSQKYCPLPRHCFIGDVLLGTEQNFDQNSTQLNYLQQVENSIQNQFSFSLYGVFSGASYNLTQKFNTQQISNFSSLLTPDNKFLPGFHKLLKLLNGTLSAISDSVKLQEITSETLQSIGAVRYQEFVNKGVYFDVMSSEKVGFQLAIVKYGFKVPKGEFGVLQIKNVNKLAHLYVNDNFVQEFQNELVVNISSEDGKIEILVMPGGYDKELDSGITGVIEFNEQVVNHVSIQILDLFEHEFAESKPDFWSGESVYRTVMNLQKKGFYARFNSGAKGYFYVNGMLLGYFEQGNKLYCPQDYMNDGENVFLFVSAQNQLIENFYGDLLA